MPRYCDPGSARRDWSLFSGQGQTLLAIVTAPEHTVLQLARDLSYAHRRITGFLHDLEAADMLTRQRVDRHNCYTIHAAASARIPGLSGATVGDVLQGVQRQSEEAS